MPKTALVKGSCIFEPNFLLGLGLLIYSLLNKLSRCKLQLTAIATRHCFFTADHRSCIISTFCQKSKQLLLTVDTAEIAGVEPIEVFRSERVGIDG